MMNDIPCPIIRSDISCYWKDMWCRLDAMRRLRELCDVSLCTDDGIMFTAHSPVLAASSDILRQLLLAAQSSSYGDGCSIVHVSNVTKDVLRVTLDFIYGKTPVSRIDFERLQAGAARLNLPGAYEYCSRRLNEECVGLWKQLDSTSMQINRTKWLQSASATQACQQAGLVYDSGMSSSSSVSASSHFELHSGSASSGSEDSCNSVVDVADSSSNVQSSLDHLLSQNSEFDEIDDHFISLSASNVIAGCDVDKVVDCSPLTINSSLSEQPHSEISENFLDNGCSNMVRAESASSNDQSTSDEMLVLHKNLSDALAKHIVSLSSDLPMPLLSAGASDDCHAALMAQMSLDDLARVEECPHLRRLSGSGSFSLQLLGTEKNLPSTAADFGSVAVNLAPSTVSQRDQGHENGAFDSNGKLHNDIGNESMQTVDGDVHVSYPVAVGCVSSVKKSELLIPAEIPNDFSRKAVEGHTALSEPVSSNTTVCSNVTSKGAKEIICSNASLPNSNQSTANLAVTCSTVSQCSPSFLPKFQINLSPHMSSTYPISSIVNSSSDMMVTPLAVNMSPFVTNQLVAPSTPRVLLGSHILPSPDIGLASGLGATEHSPACDLVSGGNVSTVSDATCRNPSENSANPSTASCSTVVTNSLSSFGQPDRSSQSNSLDDASTVPRADEHSEKQELQQSSSLTGVSFEEIAGSGNSDPALNPVSANTASVPVSQSADRTCCFCYKQCKTERQLISHIRNAHSSPDGGKICAQCSTTFATVTELASHLQMSHGRVIDNQLILALARLNGNACYMGGCNYQNQHADALQRHIYQRHSIGRPTIACLCCKQAFFSTSQLNRHMTRAHASKRSVTTSSTDGSCNEPAVSTESVGSVPSPSGTADHQLPCPDCGVLLASSYKLQIHQLRAHAKGKLFTCQHCSFKSPRKKDVQAHMLSQHGTAPSGVHVYSCSACNYKCIDKNRYEEHEAMHTGIQRYQCTLCANVYTTRRGLRTHLKYHSNDRPHSCSTCGASFKVRSKLADHIKLVHIQKGLKPYVCGYCNHATALRGNCNQHIRKSHPNMPLNVIDRLASQRRSVKDYDYAGITGAGIEEHKDLRAAGWVEPASSAVVEPEQVATA